MIPCSPPELKAALLCIRILALLASFPLTEPATLSREEQKSAVSALLAVVLHQDCLPAVAAEAAVGLAYIAGLISLTNLLTLLL